MKVAFVGNARDGVGESPFWDAAAGVVWSVDITGRRILRRRWPDGATEAWEVPGLPTAIARAGGEDAVVAFADGLFRWDPAGGRRVITTVETDRRLRLNEGKCDPRGRFWVASMENNLADDLTPRVQEAACGRLFRIDEARAVPMSEAEFGIPNTMAWSPDRRSFFMGDSLRNAIWVWDYDDTRGEIDNRRIFVSGGPGLPDGSCMDSEGFLWTARFGAGRVIRYDPEGRVEREIVLPVQNPTATTFGGPDLKTLFITSGRFGLAKPTEADGALLAVETAVRGQEENRYEP